MTLSVSRSQPSAKNNSWPLKACEEETSSQVALESGDQRPDGHYDEEQDQDHDDQGYKGTPAHATVPLRYVSIWRSILVVAGLVRQRLRARSRRIPCALAQAPRLQRASSGRRGTPRSSRRSALRQGLGRSEAPGFCRVPPQHIPAPQLQPVVAPCRRFGTHKKPRQHRESQGSSPASPSPPGARSLSRTLPSVAGRLPSVTPGVLSLRTHHLRPNSKPHPGSSRPLEPTGQRRRDPDTPHIPDSSIRIQK